MTHSKMIGRRQFLKSVAAGTVVLAAPYLLLPRKSAIAQVAGSAAFIGAQGFGAGTNGWRSASAQILFVTNLNNSGAGSLRQALIATTGPRYIIFRVAGYITLSSQMTMEDSPGNAGSVYVAGQTAPGGGITIRPDGTTPIPSLLNLRYGQSCLRHLRFRHRIGSGGGSGFAQALTVQSIGGQSNVMLDHLSASWTTDDVMSFIGMDLVTMQRCLLTEGFNVLWLFPAFGSARRMTAHHNYWSHCRSRYPESAGSSYLQSVSNLIYNWGAGAGFCQNYSNFGATPQIDVIKLWAKWGPSSQWGQTPGEENGFEIMHNNSEPGNNGSIFMSGNRALLPSAGEVDQRVVSTQGGGLTVVGSRHHTPTVAVTEHDAATLESIILPDVGCTKPARDSVDQAIVDSYAAFTGQSEVGTENGTVSGVPFPTIASGTPDHLEPSGMTQEFITRMGLANTVASALSTSISQSRGLGEDYQNIEWNLMEKAGDNAPLNGGGGSTPPAPPTGLTVS